MKLKAPLLFLLLATGILFHMPATALTCESGSRMEHTFDSGANWLFCAVIDPQHGLELQQLHYRAPGDSSRRVLAHLHLGQVLFQPHDQEEATAVIGQVDYSLGGGAIKPIGTSECQGTLHTVSGLSNRVCTYERPTGLMAKYSTRPGLQGEQFRVFAISNYQGFNFQTTFGLSEDGRIQPSVALSGRSDATTNDSRFGNPLVNPETGEQQLATSISILYTWRMVFGLNDNEVNDRVEEFNFVLDKLRGNRRPMTVTALTTETLRNIDPENFRGWRVVDSINGSGYYLDPQKSGLKYTDRKNNWAQFEFAVTAFRACEKHSLLPGSGIATNTCGTSLDFHVNGESLAFEKPVIWYNQHRIFRPSSSDFPIIGSLYTDFELIPFDWTATSPFEVIGE